jgi:hypothetical protein
LAIGPWRARSAIHLASFTSVLRPGTFRMYRALPTIRVRNALPTRHRPAPVNAGCSPCRLASPQALAASPATLPDRASSPEWSAPASSATRPGRRSRRRQRPSPGARQTGAPLNNNLRLRLHSKEGDRDAAGIVATLPRVPPSPGATKYAKGAGLSIGVASHLQRCQPQHDRPSRDWDKPAHAATIFTHNGAPKALVGCLAEASFVGVGEPPGLAERPTMIWN